MKIHHPKHSANHPLERHRGRSLSAGHYNHRPGGVQRSGQRQPGLSRRQDHRLRLAGAAIHRLELFLAAAFRLLLRHRRQPASPRRAAATSGPTSGALQTNVMNNASAFISGNNLPTNTVVPADMVFASASGIGPAHQSRSRASSNRPRGRLARNEGGQGQRTGGEIC